MKTSTLTFFALVAVLSVLITSCETEGPPVNSIVGSKNETFITETFDALNLLQPTLQANDTLGLKSIGNNEKLGDKVALYPELIDLFDPSNFPCGCDDKMKRALKKIKPENQKTPGFIPNVVVKNAFMADSVLLLNKGGSNVLAHIFQYKKNGGTLSIPLFAKNASTTNDFNEINFIETNPKTYDQFAYTMDCSGFISAAVDASGGVSTASIKTAATVAVTAKISLFVIGGVMYSPLCQAYNGEGVFANNDTLRKNVLNAILSEIPEADRIDNTEIIINSNYQMLFTSNTGTAGFNGTGILGAQGNVSAGFGQVHVNVDASGSIGRKSDYTKYKTYIVDKNIHTIPPTITVKSIKDLINHL